MSTMKASNDLEREKLPAEQKFDKRVYGGISYFGQALTGSALTYWVKHAGGRPIYDKMADWLGPNFIEKISKKRGKEAIASADWWITVSTMVAVGTAFIIPVKWLEDKKAGIVKKWTEADNEARAKAGNPITEKERQHQQELLAELEASPKQSWTSLLIGRAASLVPVYTGVFAFDTANKKMETAFQNFTKSVAKNIGFKNAAKSEVLHNVSGIAFYDGFYSMISAGGLYVFSKLSAPFTRDKEPEQTVSEPDTQPKNMMQDMVDNVVSEQFAQETHHAGKIERKARPAARTTSFTDYAKPSETNFQLSV